MAELDFHTLGNLWCIWLEKVYTYCQPTLQETLLTLLAVLKWLTRPIIGNFEAFSGLNLALHRLRCSACIFNKCAPFPFLRRKKDEWFSLPPAGTRKQPVKVINVSRDRQGRKGSSYSVQYGIDNFPQSLSDADFEIFYHGTSHESAEDIINYGINVNKGGKRKDFSDGDGFYLCKDFNETSSTRWAKNRPPCSAVLIFRVARAEFRDVRNGLDLQEDIEEWRRVVRYFRLGEYTRRLQRQLEEYDFIEGPMAGEGQNFRNPTPINNMYQLCIRNDESANLFHGSLHSAVFFEPDNM